VAIPRFTENTITKGDRLGSEIHGILPQGDAVNNMGHEANVRWVGAPIWDHAGKVFAAVSVSSPSQRITLTRSRDIARARVEKTREISLRLECPGQKNSAAFA
jgi:DNA-binding IclR family transcriptional regulator